MSRLILLNGPPGIGKSTLARRYAAEHPGVLNCDIDVLRTLIGGWEQDFPGSGRLIRPVAFVMVSTYLAGGHDVVLPQLLADPEELSRFESCAAEVGAEFVERFLMDSPAAIIARFSRRGRDEASSSEDRADPWHDQVRAIVAAQGGDAELIRCHAQLERLLAERPGAVSIPSPYGDIDATYRALVDSLAPRRMP